MEFFNEVRRQLKSNGVTEIIERNVKVFRFKDVLSELMTILEAERVNGNVVYVNVSGGSSEYGAASTLASMMVDGVIPFTVSTKEYMISGNRVKECYYEDGQPIGISRSVNPPKALPVFHLNPPPRQLVRALRVLIEKKDRSGIASYTQVISDLKSKGLWDRRMGGHERDVTQSERMYYARHYIDQWVLRGWVVREGRGDLKVTEDGRMVTEIFYHDHLDEQDDVQ